MKNLYTTVLLSCFAFLSTANLLALQPNKQQAMGSNPYTYSPLEFIPSEGKGDGRFWAGNQQYPGKAYVGDEEYINVVVIEKSLLAKKPMKKLRKGKIYIGYYIDAVTNIEYQLYGDKKNPDPVNENPDADVITMKAIEEDYGIGE